MFLVRAKYKFDVNTFVSIDEKLKQMAGENSVFSGCGFGLRDQGWYVTNFNDAISMMQRLGYVEGVNATIEER